MGPFVASSKVSPEEYAAWRKDVQTYVTRHTSHLTALFGKTLLHQARQARFSAGGDSKLKEISPMHPAFLAMAIGIDYSATLHRDSPKPRSRFGGDERGTFGCVTYYGHEESEQRFVFPEVGDSVVMRPGDSIVFDSSFLHCMEEASPDELSRRGDITSVVESRYQKTSALKHLASHDALQPDAPH